VLNGILGEQKKSRRYKRDTSKVKATYVNGFVIFKDKNIYFKAPLDKAVLANTVAWLYHSSADYSRSETWLVYTIPDKRKRTKYALASQYIRQLSSKEIMHWELPNIEINESLGLFFY